MSDRKIAVVVLAPTVTPLLRWWRTVVLYVRVLKPKETLLLWFIGLCTALVAANGAPSPGRFLLVAVAILMGSGGANGLTNYLDRRVDARMVRTRHRVLASGLIDPAEKGLAWSVLLVAAGLGIAYYLHPFAFIAGLGGVIAAAVARKTWATHFLGAISSIGPVLVAWFASRPQVDMSVCLLSAIIILWVPVHVWNLMLAWRDDYVQAGVNIFPLTHGLRLTSVISLVFSIAMSAAVFLLWGFGEPGWVYLIMAAIPAVIMVVAGVFVFWKTDSQWTFRVFRLSAYPFLGMTFSGLVLDVWLRGG